MDLTLSYALSGGDDGTAYDPLNRLATAKTTSATKTCWDEAFRTI